MRCIDCKLWGEGTGGGFNYDAGSVNYCNHRLISGRQHPSSASYDDNCISKVIVDGSDKEHKILTRWNFGCVLFVAREGKE
jgi:hypothetical protein